MGYENTNSKEAPHSHICIFPSFNTLFLHPNSLMETFILFISFFFLITSGYGATPHHHHNHRENPETYGRVFRATKLFVFGDSYADTGNFIKSLGGSWVQPYGTTFPGKPAGRFSDGRVLTDYIARFLGLKSPLAYRWMKIGGKKLRYGMNFAYGGSGVFNTLGDLLPNMTTQIGFFQKLVDQNVYTKSDLQSSLVLLTLSGNDYATFIANGGTFQGLQSFIPRVINQLGANLKLLQELGATKVAVASLQPLGCLPRVTQLNSFQQCNATQNVAVNFHNLLLHQTVSQLNNQSNSSTFHILDLFTSFSTVLNQKQSYQGDLKFETPLKPCCIGINSDSFCGNVDEKGVKLYTVCSDPKSAFFWDGSHPSEAGWHAVYTNLKSGLQQLFKC